MTMQTDSLKDAALAAPLQLTKQYSPYREDSSRYFVYGLWLTSKVYPAL